MFYPQLLVALLCVFASFGLTKPVENYPKKTVYALWSRSFVAKFLYETITNKLPAGSHYLKVMSHRGALSSLSAKMEAGSMYVAHDRNITGQ
jgi:hypothetical protein